MEHAIAAQFSAKVSDILVAVGGQDDAGETLVLLEVE
jgi:biotin carboxyl carrier protein